MNVINDIIIYVNSNCVDVNKINPNYLPTMYYLLYYLLIGTNSNNYNNEVHQQKCIRHLEEFLLVLL